MNEDKKSTFAADKAHQQRLRDVDASAAMAEYKASKVADQAKGLGVACARRSSRQALARVC
jgi:hypothetical protein